MIGIENIHAAAKVIKDLVVRTPTVFSPVLSERTNAQVFMKLENLQLTGAFKIRGALNKISRLASSERERGVITASSGNHGLAVAYGANVFDLEATVYVPENPNLEKLAAIKALGAKVVRSGKDYEEAFGKAIETQRRTGSAFIHAFDDPAIIAGQGTIGLEVLQDLPELDTLIVPVGGGGLISGIAAAAKAMKPKIRVVGVQSTGAPAVYESWRKRRIVRKKSVETIADGLASRQPGDLTFQMIRKYVGEMFLVTDSQMCQAILFLARKLHIIAEPSAAASLAALLFKYKPRVKERIGLIVSGGNISSELLNRLLTSRP